MRELRRVAGSVALYSAPFSVKLMMMVLGLHTEFVLGECESRNTAGAGAVLENVLPGAKPQKWPLKHPSWQLGVCMHTVCCWSSAWPDAEFLRHQWWQRNRPILQVACEDSELPAALISSPHLNVF